MAELPGLYGYRRGLMRWETQRAPATASLVRQYAGVHGGTALDLGCGSLAVADELREDFDRIVGVDIDALAATQAATRRAGRAARHRADLAVVRADAERLPFASASFDLVYSYGTLHHTRLENALPEVARVLVPGGVALLVDFTADTPRRGLPSHVAASLRAFPGYRQRVNLTTALSITLYRLSPAWLRHARRDVFLRREEFRTHYGAHLPGAVFHDGRGRVAVWWRKVSANATGTEQ